MENPTAMTHFDIQKASLLDLLFEQRNKQYGAYVLRKYYANRLYLALGLTLTAVFGIFFIAGRMGGSDPMAALRPSATPGVTITEVEFKRPEQKPVEPPKAKKLVPPSSSLKVTPPVIVPDHLADKPLPSLDEMAKKRIDNVTVDVPGGDPHIFQGPPSTGGGDGPLVKAVTPPEEPIFVPNPSEAPHFPGGDAAWRDYLAKMLSTPSDMEAGEKRSVLVRFLVDETGAVTGFQILRSGGASFDNEVLRVLRKMPRWKPARQNGRAVATAFQQPITFQAPEE